MCIIISNSKGLTLKEEYVKRSYRSNNNSAGLMFVEDGEVKIIKSVPKNGRSATDEEINEFWNTYKGVREANPDSNIVLHFRISTGGKINEENCHPFHVTPRLGFCHNGMISGLNEISKDHCDTVHLNRTVLQPMVHWDQAFGYGKNFIFADECVKAIKKIIGTSYNKLAFLHRDNKVVIINEGLGIWEEGNWYSNTTYKSGFDRGGRTSYSSSSYSSYSTSSKKNTFNSFEDYYNHRESTIHNIGGKEKDVYNLTANSYYQSDFSHVRSLFNGFVDYEKTMKARHIVIMDEKSFMEASKQNDVIDYDTYLYDRYDLLVSHAYFRKLTEKEFNIVVDALDFDGYSGYLKTLAEEKNPVFMDRVKLTKEEYARAYPMANESAYLEYVKDFPEEKEKPVYNKTEARDRAICNKFNDGLELSKSEFKRLRKLSEKKYYEYVKRVITAYKEVFKYRNVDEYRSSIKSTLVTKDEIEEVEIPKKAEETIKILEDKLQERPYDENLVEELGNLYAHYSMKNKVADMLNDYTPTCQGDYNLGMVLMQAVLDVKPNDIDYTSMLIDYTEIANDYNVVLGLNSAAKG